MPVLTSDHLNVIYTNIAAPSLHVKITTITGLVIYSDEVMPFDGSYNKTINLNEEAAGAYILGITSDNETITRKIVKL